MQIINDSGSDVGILYIMEPDNSSGTLLSESGKKRYGTCGELSLYDFAALSSRVEISAPCTSVTPPEIVYCVNAT
jgi:hypothetical protein